MKRMLLSSAVALAFVAALGVHEATAQKGKEQRKRGLPVKVRIISENLTTGEVGRHISAAAGDEVRINLYVDNRTGEEQIGMVHVVGGIPGCMIDETVYENFLPGEQKTASQTGFVPDDQSGVLTVDVHVLMTKTGDAEAWDGSVTFGAPLKGQAPTNVSIFQRTFARLVVRSMLTLSSKPSVDSVSDLKELFR